VKLHEPIGTPADGSYEVYLGGGEPCLPGDPDACGDGGGRSQARLIYPKGLVFTRENELVFVDGSTVRRVEQGGKLCMGRGRGLNLCVNLVGGCVDSAVRKIL
jgi:hypothetical protein